MGSLKQKPPDAPNYQGLVNASKASARLAARVAEKQLQWAKQQYWSDKKTTDQVVGQALAVQDINNRNAAEDRERYERIYQPLENELAREAQDYASPQRKAYEMGRAQADVAQQFAGARKAATDQLEGFGIDPSSTRYAALDIGLRANEAAARAGAGNMASDRVDNLGRAMRSEAINVGKGYPGQIAGTYGTALQAGNQGVNSTLATTATGANTMGTGPQWMSQANAGYGTAGNLLNMGFNNQLGAYNAAQGQSSGLGSALGMIGGLGFRALGFAEGGDVPEDEMMEMDTPAQERAEGESPHYVSPALSPSRGKAIDDVPARLNAGEFVIPKHVVEFKGEEFFHKLISNVDRAREKATQQSGAKPEMKQALPTGEFA